MITKIHLENFKIFENVEINLKPFTVLMGENSSGKTTILQAIALSLRILHSTDLITWDKDNKKVLFRGKGIPYSQLPGLYVDNPYDLFYAKIARGGRAAGATTIKIEIDDDVGNKYRLGITTQFGAFVAKNNSSQNDFKSKPILHSYAPLFISGYVGIPPNEERLFPVALEDRLNKGLASEVIRNILVELNEKDVDAFQRLSEKIKKNFNIKLDHVISDPLSDIYVHANYAEQINNKNLSFDLSSAGSGFLQVLQILAPIYLYSKKVKVVLLDEPDAHLHPNLQRATARILKEVAEDEKLQLIISTHSTHIIREVEPESVIPVNSEKKNLNSLSSSSEIEDEIILVLDNYTAAKAGISGKVLFIEDKSKTGIEAIDRAVGTRLFDGPNTIPVLSAQGKDDKIPFRVKEPLEKLTGTSIEIYFLRDSDGLSSEYLSPIMDHARDSSVNLFMLPVHEIENLLICTELIQELLQEHQIILNSEEIEVLLIQAMRDTVQQSIHNLLATLRDGIQKTNYLLGNYISSNEAESLAQKLQKEYHDYDDFEQLRKIAPGKESLKIFLEKINTTYSKSISVKNLWEYLKIEHLDESIIYFLQSLQK